MTGAMARTSRRPVARIAAIVLGFPALVSALVWVFVTAFPDSPLLGGRGVAIILGPTALFGALVNRWWTCALPLAWSAAPLVVLRAVDLVRGECSVCSSGTDWSNYPLITLAVVVIPLTAALAVGVAVRRASRVAPWS
jgi:hypothetical protein